MEKSYSDFAKELGVSKQKLNYYVNDENKEKFLLKKATKIMLPNLDKNTFIKRLKIKMKKKKAKKKKKILRYFLIA
ncbi:hypothetical protein [Lactococcus lactis]|uniref:hypothetical protein n=1 Tax=Lactococcus lactis TaxID=1358 RepID=UPI00207D2AC2|nr:hypothetical protein [Lactococcus lactis]MCO0817526.1 hypothetical protein [Lactococcus lactis]